MLELTARHAIAATGLIAGSVLVMLGLALLFRRRSTGSVRDDPPSMHVPSPSVGLTVVLLTLLLVGTSLRLQGLTEKTLTHTEAIVPNIVWPADVSWPPTRETFYDTFWWHFHSEGHPPAYYFFMWLWTTLVGTDLWALRTPSAVFGILSILLTFALGSITYGRRAGLLAAGFVALSGFHMYWSQFARMYMMASFLGLLSTWLLLRAATDGQRRWEMAYVLVSSLAVYTQTFYWTILAAHMLWIAVQSGATGIARRRILYLQAIVIILGAPALAHVIYLGDDVTLPGPSLAFIAHYLSLGFLFEPDFLSIPPRTIPSVLLAAITAISLFCISRAGSGYSVSIDQGRGVGHFSTKTMTVLATGSVLLVLAIAILAHRRNEVVALVALVPFIAVVLPTVIGSLSGQYDRRVQPTLAKFSIGAPSLPLLLAFFAPAIVFVISFTISMLAPSAFLIFIPYLLIIVAAGSVRLMKLGRLGPLVVLLLVLVTAASILHFKNHPNEGIDYADLGRKMTARMGDGDLLFVPKRSWVTTPLFYYLKESEPVYVAGDFHGAVEHQADARVWLLELNSVRWGPYSTTSDEMKEALDGFTVIEEVRSRRARAKLYVRSP